jgi:hypothetical protein
MRLKCFDMNTEKEKPPKAISHVSHGPLSIARRYGGLTYNGASYVYISRFDVLIRADLLKKSKGRIVVAASLEEIEGILNEIEP